MNPVLDELDKNIISYLTKGVYSYTELGELCHVQRSTIYRRISRLEKTGIIRKKIMAIPNFMKLDLSAIDFMIDVRQTEVDEVIKFLKSVPKVKFLWKTYGTHNVAAVIICNKGEEGQCISNLREALEKMGAGTHKFDASISSSWEKVDLSPF